MNLSMIKQAMELKSKMEKAQKELAKTKVESTAGDGAVKVTANAQQKVLSIKIDPSVIDPDKPENLEKLVLKAVTGALDEAKKVSNERLSEITGGMKVPGLTE